jgi:aminoglycoside phosphotransferase (APT) family kinase protein
MPEWSPEHVVDEQLARRLIAGQFPELGDGPLELLGEGWDSTVWLFEGRLVFRFPRREVVVPGLLRETEALAVLGPLLPLPVPVALYRGRSAEGFPWPWSGSAYLPGREPADAAPSDDERVPHGFALGRFLRALHDVDPAAVLVGGEQLPVDVVRRADMPYRMVMLRRRLEALQRLELWRPPPGLEPLLAAAIALEPPARLTVAHGDLHLRHLLIGADGQPSGVIDWIDVCRADPAIDMPLYWGYLPPAGRDAFHAAYGPVPPEGLLRARVLAVFLWATLAEYAADTGMPALGSEAVAGLDRATADLG